MRETRIEKDSLGEIEVPSNALYAAQTQRALQNFAISGLTMPQAFIRALALIKKAAAQTNLDLALLEPDIAMAIVSACDEILEYEYADQFPVDVFQTGSGTSSNMNINEVLATLASRSLGSNVSANDHVNMGQSSNDVIPSAIHISAVLELETRLLPSLRYLQETLRAKASTLSETVKTGRTHLMDAMPITMQQELEGWASQLEQIEESISFSGKKMLSLAQGGTAVGTGVNTHKDFAALFASKIASATGFQFEPSRNFFASLSSQDAAVSLSGQMKTLAVALMKISNDLRWMNSGPLAGLGEISLEALQPGSSIMPGKVNPVIPEAVAMVAAQVIGNDATITVAGQSGNFQLNVMLPVIAYNLLQSLDILANAMSSLADESIKTFTVNNETLEKSLATNPILVTALNPIIGYSAAAKIAQQAYAEGRTIVDVASEQTELSREELLILLNPSRLTQ
ncbi:MAG: class II fumarate hydratase [Pseudohongiellaceae bacterium]|nr:class II fumarate hydratase [Pseudohongiellaceae bacterium]